MRQIATIHVEKPIENLQNKNHLCSTKNQLNE